MTFSAIAPVLLRYLIQFSACMAAIIAFSALFHAPRQEYLYCGLAGSIGWITYCILRDLGFGLIFSNFTATAALTLFSWRMSVRRQMPVSVYLIPGIFPLVPGAGIYYTAYYFFMGFPNLALAKAIESFETAGAITVGIMLGSYLIRFFLHHRDRPRRQETGAN